MTARVSKIYICPSCNNGITADQKPKTCPGCKYQFGEAKPGEFKLIKSLHQQALQIAMKRIEELPPLTKVGDEEIPKDVRIEEVRAAVQEELRAYVLSRRTDDIIGYMQTAEYIVEHAMLFQDPNLQKGLLGIAAHIGRLSEILHRAKLEGVRFNGPPAAAPAGTAGPGNEHPGPVQNRPPV